MFYSIRKHVVWIQSKLCDKKKKMGNYFMNISISISLSKYYRLVVMFRQVLNIVYV